MLLEPAKCLEHLAGWSPRVEGIEPLFIVTFAGHHVARMAKCVHDAFPVFARGFFAARKIDDERVAALCGDGTRQHCVRRDLQAVIAHGFGNAGNLAVAHVARGFRRYIARRKAASATGEYDVGTNFIAGFENAACDKHAVVLDVKVAGNLPDLFLNKLFEGRARGVFLHGTRVGARDNGKFKSHEIAFLERVG